MNPVYEKVVNCYNSCKDKIPFRPKVALVLGSGLGSLADEIEVVSTLSYKDIRDFPISTAPGHKGRFVFGYIEEVPVVIMQGRIHFYEGYPITDVVLPTRLMKMMGAEILFLTNACGSVNPSFKAGDFMILKDQIAQFVPSPLVGENIEEFGPRFCDMSEVYDKDLREILHSCADALHIAIHEGTYIQLTGPAFETPAEVRMCGILGADAVGMSTACEAVAANHMGMKICGISCITNLGCGLSDTPLSHEEVQETADRVAPLFKALVRNSIAKMK